MVTLTDLSPERLETKPIWVLRALRWPGVAMEDMMNDYGLGRARSGRDGGFAFLFVGDGLEVGDVLAERAQLVGLLDLSGLLAQAKLEELLAGFAELGGDLGGREIADFFGSHNGRLL